MSSNTIGNCLIGAGVVLGLLMGAFELYELGRQDGARKACAAKTSFQREYAPALPSLERKAHYGISTIPVGGA